MVRRMPTYPKGLKLQHTHTMFNVESRIEIEVIGGYDVIITKIINAPFSWTGPGRRARGGASFMQSSIRDEIIPSTDGKFYSWEGRSQPTTFNDAFNLITGYHKDPIWKPL